MSTDEEKGRKTRLCFIAKGKGAVFVYDRGKVVAMAQTDRKEAVVFGAVPFKFPLPHQPQLYYLKKSNRSACLNYWTTHKLQKRIVCEGAELKYKYRTKLEDLRFPKDKDTDYWEIVRFHSVGRLDRFLRVEQGPLNSRLKKLGYSTKQTEQSKKTAKNPVSSAALKTTIEKVKRIENYEKRNFILYYLGFYQRGPLFFELCRFYSWKTLEYVLKIDTEEQCETLLLYANRTPAVPDYPLYCMRLTKQVVYGDRLDENLKLWKHVYPKDTVKAIEARTESWALVNKHRRQEGNRLLPLPEDKVCRELYEGIDVYSPATDEVVSLQILSKLSAGSYMLKEDYELTLEFLSLVRARDSRLCEGGVPDLDDYPDCEFMFPNTSIEKSCKALWDKTKWNCPKSTVFGNGGTTPESVCFCFVERWPMALLVKTIKAVEARAGGCDEVKNLLFHVHDAGMEIATTHTVVDWLKDLEEIREKLHCELLPYEDTVVPWTPLRPLPPPVLLNLDTELVVQWFTDHVAKREDEYILAPNRAVQKKLMETLGGTPLQGALLCKKALRPRLFNNSSKAKWLEKGTMKLTIATYADISIFGAKKRVLLCGGPWNTETLDRAKSMALEAVVLIKRKPTCGVKSLWNFSEDHDSFQKTNKVYRESGLYAVMELTLKREAAERLKTRDEAEESSEERIARLKSKTKELAEKREAARKRTLKELAEKRVATRKRTAEEAELEQAEEAELMESLDELFGED
jgi:hypothetical protein